MKHVIYGFHYSEIARFKKHCRNQLLHFSMHADENDRISVTTDVLAKLFLIDADNIEGEFYTQDDLAVVEPVLDEYLNGESVSRELTLKDVQMFLDLAMHRRLTAERNEQLVMKLAEEYNRRTDNELLRIIDMDAFREVCRCIDDEE